MEKQTDFSRQVLSYIKKIPRGRVATYGQIAALAGKPQGSRGVAWLLHSCSESHDLPWHRVLGSKGKISFPKGSSAYNRQKRLLLKEGVEFAGEKIDMEVYQWKKKASKKVLNTRSPKMFS